jgi:uncharacterized membrane protein YqjE
MMDERESGPHTSPTEGRLFAAARRMLATAVAVVHTRAELLTTELQEEVQRAASILLWSIVALFFASLTVLMIALTVLIVFWDTHRVLAAVLISAAFVAMAAGAALYARSVARAKPQFLSGTLGELKRDRAMLEGDS